MSQNFVTSLNLVNLVIKFIIIILLCIAKGLGESNSMILQFLHLHFLISVSSLMSSWQALQ